MKYKHTEEQISNVINLYCSGLSETKVSIALNISKASVHRILIRNSIKTRPWLISGLNTWKNEDKSLIDEDGYKRIFNLNHPRTRQNRIPEHLFVAEKKYGRLIANGEPIHHIDLNKLNNTEDNLYLYNNKSEHRIGHNSLELAGIELFKKGLIYFKDGKYYVK